jgi:hypothetical protein
LPCLINQVEPWLSSHEIAAGARWSAEIAKKLESSNVGITCLTAENQNAPWILFEAGAISKLTSVGRAIVLRINLRPADVTGPLSQFQGVSLDRDGIWKLLTGINESAETSLSEQSLSLTFEGLWPAIESELNAILAQPSGSPPSKRSTDDMLRELIDLNRTQHADIRKILSAIGNPTLDLSDPFRVYWELNKKSPNLTDAEQKLALRLLFKRALTENPTKSDDDPEKSN